MLEEGKSGGNRSRHLELQLPVMSHRAPDDKDGLIGPSSPGEPVMPLKNLPWRENAVSVRCCLKKDTLALPQKEDTYGKPVL